MSRWSRFWLRAGMVLGAVAGGLLALEYTAVAALVNVSLVSLLIAAASVAALAVGGVLRAPFAAAGIAPLVFLAGAAAIAGTAAWVGLLSYSREAVDFEVDDAHVAGTVYLPRADGRHPAIVIVHGSGPESRHEYAYYARRFARSGFATLVYDKRGVGESSGSLYGSDYHDYARDAAAAVQALRARSDVNADQVGLVGFSEAEWTAPLAAAEAGTVSFLAIIGASGLTPAQQVNAEIAIRLRSRGHSEAIISQALALNERVFDYQRKGRDRETLVAALSAASSQRWFQDAEDIPDEIFPPGDYDWWRSVMDFDPDSAWSAVTAPVLILKGGRDSRSTTDVAEARIGDALRRAGNDGFQFMIFPEADHMLLAWPLGEGIPPPLFADGYPEALIAWIKNRLDSPGGR